jgi:hypothetical protein
MMQGIPTDWANFWKGINWFGDWYDIRYESYLPSH